jgi:hypothetical protein
MRNKGVALLWSLILTFVLLIVSGSMASIIVKENQMTINNQFSAQAYGNARSGIEWGTDYLESLDPSASCATEKDITLETTVLSKVHIDITVPATGGCKISSTGTYRAATRKIEYTTADKNVKSVPPNSTTHKSTVSNFRVGDTNNGSFDFNFKFWLNSDTLSANSEFGVINSTDSSKKIALQISNTKSLNLIVNSGIKAIPLSTQGNAVTSDPNSPYAYEANIKYIKDWSVIIKIRARSPVTGQYECIGSTTLPAESMGDMVLLYAPNTSYEIATSTSSFGNYFNNTYGTRFATAVITGAQGEPFVPAPILLCTGSSYDHPASISPFSGRLNRTQVIKTVIPPNNSPSPCINASWGSTGSSDSYILNVTDIRSNNGYLIYQVSDLMGLTSNAITSTLTTDSTDTTKSFTINLKVYTSNDNVNWNLISTEAYEMGASATKITTTPKQSNTFKYYKVEVSTSDVVKLTIKSLDINKWW